MNDDPTKRRLRYGWQRRTAAASFALAAIIPNAACSSAPVTPSSEPTISTTSKAPSVSPETTPTAEPKPEIKKVAKLWREGDFQKGIQLYWHHNSQPFDAEAVTEQAEKSLDYIVDLGANSVGITFPIYVDGATPTKTYADPVETPSLEEMDILLQAAKARGLRVTLRPLIDEANIASEKDGAWRGTLKPENTAKWFDSYGDLLMEYVPLLKKYQVDEYVLGVEMFSLQGEKSEWKSLRQKIASTGYEGALSYAVNWDQSPAKVPFETLGLDMYPAVDLPDSASQKQVATALSRWLDRQPKDVRNRLTLQEVGIAALDGVFKHPWYWGASDNSDLNLSVQKKWFGAACDAAVNSQTQGIYYWMLDKYEDPSNIDPSKQLPKDFVGRPAEDAIRNCFKDN